jgi:hypothetical protein
MKPVTTTEIIDQLNKLMDARDEARRWARQFRAWYHQGVAHWIAQQNLDYDTIRFLKDDNNDLRAELGRWKAENARLRAEVERLKHLLPPPNGTLFSYTCDEMGQDTDDQ